MGKLTQQQLSVSSALLATKWTQNAKDATDNLSIKQVLVPALSLIKLWTIHGPRIFLMNISKGGVPASWLANTFQRLLFSTGSRWCEQKNYILFCLRDNPACVE